MKRKKKIYPKPFSASIKFGKGISSLYLFFQILIFLFIAFVSSLNLKLHNFIQFSAFVCVFHTFFSYISLKRKCSESFFEIRSFDEIFHNFRACIPTFGLLWKRGAFLRFLIAFHCISILSHFSKAILKLLSGILGGKIVQMIHVHFWFYLIWFLLV